MSSMVSRIALIAGFVPALFMPIACQAGEPPEQGEAIMLSVDPDGDGSDWDRARAQLLQSQPSDIAGAVQQWKMLASGSNYSFSTYASFLVTHPGWPEENAFRRNAEQAIDLNSYSPGDVVSYFQRFPPVTNTGRARYAVVLAGMGRRAEAVAMARQAWRTGTMTDADKARLLGLFSNDLTPDDHDARMDALLWANATSDAVSQLAFTSDKRRPIFAARLAMARSESDGLSYLGNNIADALTDAGFVASRATMLRQSGNSPAARQLLATRPALVHRPSDPEDWYETLLVNARAAANDSQYSTAFAIASKVDDAFPQGHDVSDESLGVRDDYTSLTWLAGTVALENLRQPAKAVGMFARYGNGARTPQTRSKGFYWAGRAAAEAGDKATATRYFEMAGEYADHYYGQLALERLGRKVPQFPLVATGEVTPQERGKFNASSLVQATQAVSRMGDWPTQRRFFGALASQADSQADHLLVAELAKQIGRRDLAVIVGQSARTKGYDGLQAIAFPQMPVPPGYENSWTMIHAITRQESQFAQNAVSHASARGLMQLMPGTAREQAGKMGLSYSFGALTDDPYYNIRLGSGYFARMLDYYGGAYPLAVAAYNAGPGNVNKWLRANGDPRTGEIDIVTWVEKIPIFETKNYVQRVLENAVVYDVMHPDHARMRGPNRLSKYLGKRQPG